MKVPITLHDRRLRIVAVLSIIILLAPFVRYAIFLAVSAGNGENIRILSFEKGATPRRIATELEAAGLITSARLFVLHARLRGDAERLQAGEYQFTNAMKPAEILRKLVLGEVYARPFAVPEGYSMYQVAELLEAKRLFSRERFLAAATDPSFLAELGIHGSSVEGYLYPSTYAITRSMGEKDLIRVMVSQFDKVYAAEFSEEARRRGISRHHLVTLASMIEKEAVSPDERPLISSVFHNRLARGMRLQSDPTAVYGVRAFGGTVTRQDVLRNTSHNTYRIAGLPPGPIGNPGRDSLAAALKPASTGYLYFVARKDGTHHFSVSLEEHNAAVRRFLKTPNE